MAAGFQCLFWTIGGVIGTEDKKGGFLAVSPIQFVQFFSPRHVQDLFHVSSIHVLKHIMVLISAKSIPATAKSSRSLMNLSHIALPSDCSQFPSAHNFQRL